ncbi:NUDIX domain-containing protein [Enterococcus timonensis]|uniref:NUDIX domain-containing protein n=1 Tax=Enterococcus timonensis TaxID=1852364 RepID=UPI00131A2208|nr:NUDIX domain-containing protein [Enterococcus timonensis]
MGETRLRSRVILYNKERNSILLIKRQKKGEKYLVVPGGGVNPGEKDEQAAIREIHEELGWQLIVNQLKLLFFVEEGSEIQKYFLYQTEISTTPQIKGEEAIRASADNQYVPIWVNIEQLGQINLVPSSAKERLIHYFYQIR